MSVSVYLHIFLKFILWKCSPPAPNCTLNLRNTFEVDFFLSVQFQPQGTKIKTVTVHLQRGPEEHSWSRSLVFTESLRSYLRSEKEWKIASSKFSKPWGIQKCHWDFKVYLHFLNFEYIRLSHKGVMNKYPLTLHRKSITDWSTGCYQSPTLRGVVLRLPIGGMGEGLFSVAGLTQRQVHPQKPTPSWGTDHENQTPRGHCTTGRQLDRSEVSCKQLCWAEPIPQPSS